LAESQIEISRQKGRKVYFFFIIIKMARQVAAGNPASRNVSRLAGWWEDRWRDMKMDSRHLRSVNVCNRLKEPTAVIQELLLDIF
jgi:hypothetical protein